LADVTVTNDSDYAGG